MDLPTLTSFFGWCAVINIALLTLTSILLLGMKSTAIKIHSSMFDVSDDALNLVYLKFLGHYKLANLVLFITPWIALKILAGQA